MVGTMATRGGGVNLRPAAPTRALFHQIEVIRL